jgi:alkylhydroperoxidase family enzyme
MGRKAPNVEAGPTLVQTRPQRVCIPASARSRSGNVEHDPKLDAVLALAREYTSNVGSVQDTTWQTAVDAGWTDEQLTELSVHVTLNLFTNYFNHFVGTELDLPEAPAL